MFPKDPEQERSGVNYYTIQLIRHLVVIYGHTLVDEIAIDKNTIILVSVCTLDSIPVLRKIRSKYPNNTIITGGQFAFNFPVCLIYSDVCVVGEGFEALRCKSLDELKALPCATWKGKGEIVIPSSFIDWKLVPACQTKKRSGSG